MDGEVIWPGGRGEPITREQARAILAEQAARGAARIAEPLSWDQTVSWLRSVAGCHAEIAISATGAPPAPFQLRGTLAMPESVDHAAYGACVRVKVAEAGSVLLAPAPAFQMATRGYAGGRPMVEVGMAMHSSMFVVTFVVDLELAED
jgi:hypothetical protein